VFEDNFFLHGWLAAGEEVALQNLSANTRPVYVAIISSHRALLQNFHHNHVHLLLNLGCCTRFAF
jgi:hypothetical protein